MDGREANKEALGRTLGSDMLVIAGSGFGREPLGEDAITMVRGRLGLKVPPRASARRGLRRELMLSSASLRWNEDCDSRSAR